jgi:hypothetical protein
MLRDRGLRLTEPDLRALLKAWRRYERLRRALRSFVARSEHLP